MNLKAKTMMRNEMGAGTTTNKTNRRPNPGKPSEEWVQIKETPKMPNGKAQMSKMSKGKLQNTETQKELKPCPVSMSVDSVIYLSNTKNAIKVTNIHGMGHLVSQHVHHLATRRSKFISTLWVYEHTLRLLVSSSTRQLHMDDTIDYTWCGTVCHIVELQYPSLKSNGILSWEHLETQTFHDLNDDSYSSLFFEGDYNNNPMNGAIYVAINFLCW